MKKIKLGTILLALLIFLSATPVFAGDSSYHNKQMMKILFSSGKCQNLNEQTETLLTMLENASYLCIDQSGNKQNDQEKLDYLNNNKVKGIVKTIEEINTQSSFLHRSYTHRGWNYSYVDDKANWKERKKILVNTAEKIFKFEKCYNTSSEAEKKRDAFCRLIYYNHILGDLYFDDEDTLRISGSIESTDEIPEKERGLIIAFAQAHPGETNPDIFWEITDSCEILFSGQNSSRKYSSLKTKLKSLAKKARGLQGQTGGVNTKERLEQRYKYEKELIEILEAYIPLLLDDAVFFRNAFPIS